MKNSSIELNYYNTYYYSNFISNLLSDRWDYLRTLHDLFENDGVLLFVKPFPKYSALHIFIEFAVNLLFDDDFDSEYTKESIEKGNPKLTINHALDSYNISHTSFKEWLKDNKQVKNDSVEDQLYEYFQELMLDGTNEELLKRISDEVFFIMFLNRDVLLLLGDLISDHISSVNVDEIEQEYQKYFKKDGVLKRQAIPRWVKKAVFYRERGKCALCGKDVSGLINLSNEHHFDHIIPLAEGGINDIINIQLLCEKCNLSKGKRQDFGTSNTYERWYEPD